MRSLTDCGCPDFLRAAAATPMSRRGLMRGFAVGGATTVVGSAVVTMSGGTASAATPAPAHSVLVVLSMRGAADGLSLVVPYGDPGYYSARPRIAIPAASLLAKDSFFGLHPKLSPLVPLWQSGQLAAVHATGLPVANRSHFAAMEEVEDASPGSAVRTGWLNRLLGTDAITSPLQGLSVGTPSPPASMYGPQDVMSFDSLDDASVAGDDQYDPTRTRLASLQAMWGGQSSAIGQEKMASAMRSAMSATQSLGPAKAQTDNSSSYPNSDLGRALSSVARTLRGDVGVSMVTVDHGNWDMHTDLGTLDWGRMNDNASDFATSIAAFFADLGSVRSKVTLVALSEFGRRVVENDNYGLDHGWGNVMFLAGAGVKGGKYYGTWPGLTTDLDSDLSVTTDYRSVLSEVVRSRTSASLTTVFPGFTPTSVGVMA